MELKPGYKLTEVGVIPEDWEVVPLGGFVKITSGASPSQFRFSGGGIPYFKVEQLGNTEKYLDVTDTPYLFESGDTVSGRSVIFAKRGAAIALNKLRILNQQFFMDTNLMALTPQDELHVEYLYYALSHIGLWKFADTTSVPQINNKHVKPLPFPLPPLPEPCAIAPVLSDTDALIESLDRLIAKKRDVKQATMQQLLTGKTRLPGFSGKWEVKRFDCVVSRLNGKVHQIETSDYQPTGKYPVVDQGKQAVIGFSDREDKRFHCPNGGVIVFGDHTCIVKFVDFDFLVGADGTQLLCGKLGQNTRFHAYQLQYRGIEPTGYNRHFKLLKEREFLAPSPVEQRAIATILSDLDAEIAALEARRDKTRALKQGMMQELLTGKTRLVKSEAAHG
jgi:type I restriction enzyme S subunit